MNSECLRITDQLRRALRGEAWHGPSLSELLSGVPEAQASSHPIAGLHSIFELVLHTEAWLRLTLDTVNGAVLPRPTPEVDWPPAVATATAWEQAVARLFATGDSLCGAIARFDDARLGDQVPGRTYDFYRLLHGVVQHNLYHAGQIALLKRAAAAG